MKNKTFWVNYKKLKLHPDVFVVFSLKYINRFKKKFKNVQDNNNNNKIWTSWKLITFLYTLSTQYHIHKQLSKTAGLHIN